MTDGAIGAGGAQKIVTAAEDEIEQDACAIEGVRVLQYRVKDCVDSGRENESSESTKLQ